MSLSGALVFIDKAKVQVVREVREALNPISTQCALKMLS